MYFRLRAENFPIKIVAGFITEKKDGGVTIWRINFRFILSKSLLSLHFRINPYYLIIPPLLYCLQICCAIKTKVLKYWKSKNLLPPKFDGEK